VFRTHSQALEAVNGVPAVMDTVAQSPEATF
jgi:hypothetical protein